MATLVVPHADLRTLYVTLGAYHRPSQDTVFDLEALRPHIPLLNAIARFKRMGIGLSSVEIEPAQIEALFTHMRQRGMTKDQSVLNAVMRLRVSLSVLEEAKA